MRPNQSFTPKPLPALLGLLLLVPLAVQADGTTSLGTVQAEAGGSGGASAATRHSAPYQALTQGSLTATQPQSIISQNYIDENAAPTANYTDIINIAPSVFTIPPNGAGGMETHTTSIRGLQDGQFNVTFDGIPFGDSNDFTHHTTSYFMNHDLGQISVNRGPGTAATIGDATFGGTVAMLSKNPTATASVTPYFSYGSWNTLLEGGELNTGSLKSLHGGAMVMNIEHLSSDGRLKYGYTDHTNLFDKIEIPINDSTVVTLEGMYNKLHQNVPVQVTPTQIALYGYDYGGLSSSAGDTQNYRYNYDDIQTDFEYIDVRSNLNHGWSFDNKAYTYGYFHHGFNGDGFNSDGTSNNTGGFAGTYGCPAGEVPIGNPFGTTVNFCDPNPVAAQKMTMDYRSFGDVARGKKDLPGLGSVEAGIWGDHQINSRTQYDIAQDLGPNAYITGTMLTKGNTNYDHSNRDMRDNLTTIEPYVELHWKALPGLTVSPGVRYVYFSRGVNAVALQTTMLPANFSVSWQKALPYFDVHYAINPHWAAYAQVAQGFLAPNLNLLYTTTPTSSFSPEQTMNYQVGTSYQADRLSLSGDAYLIDFSNYVTTDGTGVNKYAVNAGGATYKGLEAEGTYRIVRGLNFYANASLSSQNYSGANYGPIANAPDFTAAFGPIYSQHGIYASLLAKYVGKTYGTDSTNGGSSGCNDGDVNGSKGCAINGYMIANMAVNYTLPAGTLIGSKGLKAGLTINNLFDHHGYLGGSGGTYWTIPGRSYFFTMSAPF